MDKRARMVRNHAYVMMKLRQEQRKEYFVQQILFWDKIRFEIFSPLLFYGRYLQVRTHCLDWGST